MRQDVLDPDVTTRPGGPAIDAEWLTAAAKLPTSTLHEAGGKIGALPAAIKPTVPGMTLCGRAVPVHSPPGDNLWLHRAIYAAEPGDILVIGVGGAHEHGYWGEIMSTAAKARRLGGMCIDGCVRDVGLLAEIGFPIFARGLSIRGTNKDFGARGWINAPVAFGDVTICAGDLVVGDADGVVCVPSAMVEATLAAAEARERHESDILRRLAAGETTLSIYGWGMEGRLS